MCDRVEIRTATFSSTPMSSGDELMDFRADDAWRSLHLRSPGGQARERVALNTKVELFRLTLRQYTTESISVWP